VAWVLAPASEITYIVSRGALSSTQFWVLVEFRKIIWGKILARSNRKSEK